MSRHRAIEALVKHWLEMDRDEGTRAEIEQLWQQNRLDELDIRLQNRLAFGTAGLRGRMGAGFSQLNSLTIIQTSQGLAEYLLSAHPDTREAGLVIGHDGRHHSLHFAKLVAGVFLSKTIKVWWYEDVVHTPMVPFAVKHLEAAGGVMITASHNPAHDNGYKVYGPNGCQINAPIDAQIAASILENLAPITWDTGLLDRSQLKRDIRDQVMILYTGHLWNCLHWESFPSLPEPTFPSFVYTPMHGVGLPFMQKAVGSLVCSLKGPEHPPMKMTVVPEQAHPDPDFPTVKFPNPEEDGALDLAKATADKHGMNLIIANDPDADRLAIAEKVDGVWIQLTGDQLGVLLAYFILSQSMKSDQRVASENSNGSQSKYVLASAVSSQMLGVIASDFNASFEETLTGFKWLGSRALELEKQGKDCVFAYEEALGYMIPAVVYDKDGVLAASAFLSACGHWGSPWAKLQELYERYGNFVTTNTYWRSSSVQKTTATFEKIRALEKPYPQWLASRQVLRWRDLTIGYDSSTADNKPDLPTSTDSQMITCWLDGQEDSGIRFTLRASGTEPKIKLYLECRSESRATAEDGARSTLRSIAREWLDDDALAIEKKYESLIC